MAPDREQDLQRGMRLIPTLHEVMPDDADERIKPIYHELQVTLRVPFVNFIFRTLANYPDYFEAAWRDLKPAAQSLGFEKAADELRAAALVGAQLKSTPANWDALGDIGQVRAYTASIHYVLPKLLLIATALDEGLAGNIAGGASVSVERSIPSGIAEGTVKIPMVNPKDAQGQLHDLFEEIKARHDHPGVASYYRSLGHWPDLLEAVWQQVRPHVNSGPYRERKAELIEQASGATRTLPIMGSAAQAANTDERAELRAILAVFRFRLIPDLLLDVSLIQVMLGDEEAASTSRFSATSSTL